METFGENNEMKNVFDGVGSIKEKFFTASGKGGSGKDTSNTAVRLRAKISDPILLGRLKELYPGSMTDAGEFLVEAQTERSQHQNRAEAYRVLRERLAEARRVPKERVATKPTKSSEKERLERKSWQGEIKEARREVKREDFEE